MTSEDTDTCTGSLALESGPSPHEWPLGHQQSLFGPEVVLASPSPLLAKAVVRKMNGICGQTFFDSSTHAGLGSSWANRLAERLAMVGSTECALIWKESVTPAGRSIFRLAPLMRHIEETESIGAPWATPTIKGDYNRKGASKQSGDGVATQMRGAQWPTPMAGTPAQHGYNAAGNNDSSRKLEVILGLRKTVNGRKSQWPTPTVADVTGGRKTRSGTRNNEMLLNGLMTTWATPAARDSKGSRTPNGSKEVRPGGQMLNEQIVETADRFGMTPNGSCAPTAKRGAPNADFPCWLMGWPEELICGAWRGIALSRSSRRKSSPRFSKR